MRIARNVLKDIKFAIIFVIALLGVSFQARSQEAAAPYSKMAPIDQYLIADRNAEIAMARSAAPPSISADAEVMVLGSRGYETAVKGKMVSSALWSDPGCPPLTFRSSGIQR